MRHHILFAVLAALILTTAGLAAAPARGQEAPASAVEAPPAPAGSAADPRAASERQTEDQGGVNWIAVQAVLTVVALVIAIAVPAFQHRADQERIEAERRRRFAAARADLPLALAAVRAYAKETVQYALMVREDITAHKPGETTKPRAKADPPPPPDKSHVNTLRALILDAEPPAETSLRALFDALQIHRANIESAPPRAVVGLVGGGQLQVSVHGWSHRAKDAVLLHARAGAMKDFAAGKAPPPPAELTLMQVGLSLSTLGLTDESNFNWLIKLVGGRVSNPNDHTTLAKPVEDPQYAEF